MRDPILSPEDLLRFERSYELRGPDECWPWLHYVDRRGYPYFRYQARVGRGGGGFTSARRLAWQLANGSIPEGAVVRPLCANRACMNPQHLDAARRNTYSNHEERFWQKIDIRGEDECWEWQGAIEKRDGYGRCTVGKEGRAHRAAWMLTNGPIPAGLIICHHCDNRKCCNPRHLFLGSHQDNQRDKWRKGRGAISTNRDERGRWLRESELRDAVKEREA